MASDKKSMDRDYLDKNQVVERYLQDKLTPEEQTAFEELFLSSPDLLNELESSDRLRQGLQDLAIMDKASERSRRTNWFLSPQYAMAASVLLVISLGVSGLLYHRLGDVSTVATPGMQTTQIIPLVSVRGAASDQPVNRFRLDDEQQMFVLMLDPGFTDYSSYRVAVTRVDSQDHELSLWEMEGMLPGYQDMLALTLPGASLKPGDYRVDVQGWRDQWPSDRIFEPVDTLYFRVIAPR